MEARFKIGIPTDLDGYFSLCCPYCSNRFKSYGHQFNEKEVLEIYCPFCGLKKEVSSFIPRDVIEHATTLVLNKALDSIYNSMQETAKELNRNKFIKMTVNKPKKENPKLLKETEDLQEISFSCCDIKVKMNVMDSVIIKYCPVCGGV